MIQLSITVQAAVLIVHAAVLIIRGPQ